uniref:Glycosyltransferase n=1 Tax=viral metagenome TaxID=1070528 RepID=A0A6C0JZH7_9ZZZZ
MKKILLLYRDFHHKNRAALYAYKSIQITPFYTPEELSHFNLGEYDAVYSPTYPIDVSKYPNTRFIFGPHFSVFPENSLKWIKGPNSVYIQPSRWAADVWRVSPLCKEIDIRHVPFGVDTHTFNEINPLNERTEVFVYYKTRAQDDLMFIKDKLHEMGITYQLFSYDYRYNESEYINCLHKAKYGIWVGRHESQGFALEEALSCNVPLLVWDVLSMNQEMGPNYADIPATTIPYWDSRCGEIFYKREHFDYTYSLFMSKLRHYKPREYVLSTLAIDRCEKEFLKLLNPSSH